MKEYQIIPSDIVTESLKYLKSGKVLDLGCGTGENAVFLSQKGFDVLAIDISENFISDLDKLCKIYNVKVESAVQDITQFDFNGKWDLILSDFVFHFLEKRDIDIVIKKMKDSTNPEGINSISVLTESNPNKGFVHMFAEGELKEYYSDWNVLFYKEEKGFAEIVARKK
jgi:tellurite methyltransferase